MAADLQQVLAKESTELTNKQSRSDNKINNESHMKENDEKTNNASTNGYVKTDFDEDCVGLTDDIKNELLP